MKPRKFVIGDVHGELKALKALLKSLKLTPHDEVIFLGDLVDKGPDTAATLDFLIDFQKKQNCVFVRGNHEEMMLAAINGLSARAEDVWSRHGGYQTMQSYHVSDLEELRLKIPPEHMAFLKGTVEACLTKTHVFVHAAWDTSKKAGQQDKETLRYKFMNAVKPDRTFPKTIICGHSSLMSGKPARKGNILCIDTIEYGWLTAYNLTENRFMQADKRGEIRHLAKAEKFRQARHVPKRFRR